jgi:hypothetical protein
MLIAVSMGATIAGVSILFGIVVSHGGLSQMAGNLMSSDTSEESIEPLSSEPSLPRTTISSQPESPTESESQQEIESTPDLPEVEEPQPTQEPLQTQDEEVQAVPVSTPAADTSNKPDDAAGTDTAQSRGKSDDNKDNSGQAPVAPAVDNNEESKDKDHAKQSEKEEKQNAKELEKEQKEKLKHEEKDAKKFQNEAKKELKKLAKELRKLNHSDEPAEVLDSLIYLLGGLPSR